MKYVKQRMSIRSGNARYPAEEGGQTAARGLSRLWYHPVTQVRPPGHSHA